MWLFFVQEIANSFFLSPLPAKGFPLAMDCNLCLLTGIANYDDAIKAIQFDTVDPLKPQKMDQQKEDNLLLSHIQQHFATFASKDNKWLSSNPPGDGRTYCKLSHLTTR